MPKKGELQITRDKQTRKWVVNVSAKLSLNGKRQRKLFQTKAAAQDYRNNLSQSLDSKNPVKFDEALLNQAQYYDDAFQLYGYQGLADACADWIRELERRSSSITLIDLLEQYKATRGGEWSDGYLDTYKWVKKHLLPIGEEIINKLDSHYWQEWLPAWREKGAYSARSYNHLRSFLVALYTMPKAVDAFSVNPIKSIPTAKIKKKPVSVFSNAEVKLLLENVWQKDFELVPWFAIAIFAGLRPESELGRLKWDDINFQDKWIRVGFGNKTDTKRFVDLSDTLMAWLLPFKDRSGKIQLPNHKNRKAKVVPETISWARDITRHTYGSNLEAHMRSLGENSKQKVLENMGHTMLQTFEQHYRNARPAKQATEFWAILPPS